MFGKSEKVFNMRALVMDAAGGRQWNDNRDSMLSRAARRAGITYRQARAVFYGEITDRHHRSVRLLMDAAERQQQEKEGRNEWRKLEQRVAWLEQRLAETDPDFHRPQIDALGARNGPGADALGVQGRTVAGRRPD